MLHSTQLEETLPKQISPPKISFAQTDVPPTNLPSEEIPTTVNDNKSVSFLACFASFTCNHKQGQPPGPRPPTPPPQFSKNDGGICTQSQAAKRRAQENDQGVNSLKYNSLLCFKNCINNRHSKSCLRKTVNFMERGDIYTRQKVYHNRILDLNFSEDSELEEDEEEEHNNLGLGGSSPIPSLHHSFDTDKTLQDIQEVKDEFEEEDLIDKKEIEEK